ncbi:hypothetical protein SAMN05660479_01517 [Microbulbifer thermotolerans]|nr:hypothetical protein SAMN05660479_01517 [Microbulbifer thermotolerans]
MYVISTKPNLMLIIRKGLLQEADMKFLTNGQLDIVWLWVGLWLVAFILDVVL